MGESPGPKGAEGQSRAMPGYVAGPLARAALAVGVAFVLRGPGRGLAGSGAAQGALCPEVQKADDV